MLLASPLEHVMTLIKVALWNYVYRQTHRVSHHPVMNDMVPAGPGGLYITQPVSLLRDIVRCIRGIQGRTGKNRQYMSICLS